MELVYCIRRYVAYLVAYGERSQSKYTEVVDATSCRYFKISGTGLKKVCCDQ